MLSQDKFEISGVKMKFLSLLLFMGFIFLHSAVSVATVYEFNADGSSNIYEAQDYLAEQRHKGLLLSLPVSSSISQEHIKFGDIISKVSEKYNVSESLIHAVIKAESAYNPNAVSVKGAGGLMQLMPATAKQYGVSDIFSPSENIDGGTKYLKFLLKKYNGNISLTVAAYNAGEGSVDKYGDVPPFPETRAYVEKISMFLEKVN